MAKLQVRREFKSLGRCNLSVFLASKLVGGNEVFRGETNIAVRDEYHVCNWPSWEHYATNQLTHQKKAALLICYSHHNTNRHKENPTYPQCEKKSIPRKVDRVTTELIVSKPKFSTHQTPTHYSTTNIPTASIAAKVMRYQLAGASLYLLISLM